MRALTACHRAGSGLGVRVAVASVAASIVWATMVSAQAQAPNTNSFHDRARDAPAGYDLTRGLLTRGESAESFTVHIRSLAKAGGVIIGTYNSREDVYAVFEVSRGIDGPSTEVCVGRGSGKIPVDSRGFTEPFIFDDGYVCSPSAVVRWNQGKGTVRVADIKYSETFGELFNGSGMTTSDYRAFLPRQVVTEEPDGSLADKVGNAHGRPLG